MNQKFAEKLKSRTQIDANGCWIWQGAISTTGYGGVYFGGKVETTHRAMWTSVYGTPPAGMFICHKCDVRACINPDHLFLGTQGDNMLDKAAKGRALPGPVTNPEWWTKERRDTRAAVSSEWQTALRQRRAIEAGAAAESKRCPLCEKWKPLSGFHKNAARDDGHKPYCKPCAIEKDSARRKLKRST